MSTHHIRFDQALWYAWGQQDAGIGANVDAADFAKAHAAQAVAMDAGRLTYLPSIQDAWKAFLAEATERTVADFEAREAQGPFVAMDITVNSFLDGLVAGGSTNIVDDRS